MQDLWIPTETYLMFAADAENFLLLPEFASRVAEIRAVLLADTLGMGYPMTPLPCRW